MGARLRKRGLSGVLFGSVRSGVLTLLFGRSEERFYFREIQRVVGGGTGAMQRELQHLVKAGLVQRAASGRQVYFSANRDAAIFPELQALFEKTAGINMTTALKPLTRLALRKKIHRLRGPILAAAEASGASEVRVFVEASRAPGRRRYA